MEQKIGVKLLDEMYKATGINGKYLADNGTIIFPSNHTVDVRDLKQIVLRKGLRYYFHVKFNSMDLVIF